MHIAKLAEYLDSRRRHIYNYE